MLDLMESIRVVGDLAMTNKNTNSNVNMQPR
jgi:hypothetical protein